MGELLNSALPPSSLCGAQVFFAEPSEADLNNKTFRRYLKKEKISLVGFNQNAKRIGDFLSQPINTELPYWYFQL